MRLWWLWWWWGGNVNGARWKTINACTVSWWDASTIWNCLISAFSSFMSTAAVERILMNLSIFSCSFEWIHLRAHSFFFATDGTEIKGDDFCWWVFECKNNKSQGLPHEMRSCYYTFLTILSIFGFPTWYLMPH